MKIENETYDSIIIGSGLGGLVAGALLSKAGRKILLLEQHYLAGGCASTYSRKGFKMEVGLHEMDGFDAEDQKVSIFKKLDIFEHLEFIKLPDFYRVKSKRFDVTLSHSVQKAKETLCDFFPEEEKAIHTFFETIIKVRAEALKFFKLEWKAKLIMPVVPLLMPTLFKNRNQSLGGFLDSITENEDLKIILAANLAYYHHDPHTLSMVFFSLAQASYFSGGSYLIKGGSQMLSNYLVDYIKKNSGSVRLRSEVVKILTKGNKAIGVNYIRNNNQKKSENAYAETIIANNAIPNLPALLKPKLAKKFQEKIKTYENSCSLTPIYICFKRPVKELGHSNYNTFILSDTVKQLKDLKTTAHTLLDSRNFSFVDYSQIDSGLAPKGKSFGTICSVDFAESWEGLDAVKYKERKSIVADYMINRLEVLIPGIKDAIEHIEVGTPKTIEHFTHNPGGAVYGFSQKPEQSGIKRNIQPSIIKNLHYASAWTFPGGGYTGAIISGSLCARKLLR
jgi:phytoene dehydrogenase-like protein